MDCFLDNALLYVNQHGFRRRFSTSTAVIKHLTGGRPSSIYVHYKCIFDTTDHVILCKKLSYFGLDGNSAQRIREYKIIFCTCNVRSTLYINNL